MNRCDIGSLILQIPDKYKNLSWTALEYFLRDVKLLNILGKKLPLIKEVDLADFHVDEKSYVIDIDLINPPDPPNWSGEDVEFVNDLIMTINSLDVKTFVNLKIVANIQLDKDCKFHWLNFSINFLEPCQQVSDFFYKADLEKLIDESRIRNFSIGHSNPLYFELKQMIKDAYNDIINACLGEIAVLFKKIKILTE